MKISVIIPAYNARPTIRACLAALTQQLTPGDYEIIVVDSSTDGTAEVVAQAFPAVRLYRCATRQFPGAARNFGIAQATGEILAFTDADCQVDVHWIHTIRAVHQQTSAPAIGGVISNGNPESVVGWGYYFYGLSQWMPGTPAGPRQEVPTGCLSLKRWAYAQYGPFLEGTYCSDTAFHWKLVQAGVPPLFTPALHVAHTNPTRVGELVTRAWHHGRAFATVRAREQQWSRVRRLLYLAGTPLLPLWLFGRTVRHVMRARCYRKEWRRAWPFVLLGLSSWSLGEGLGYALPQTGHRKSST